MIINGESGSLLTDSCYPNWQRSRRYRGSHVTDETRLLGSAEGVPMLSALLVINVFHFAEVPADIALPFQETYVVVIRFLQIAPAAPDIVGCIRVVGQTMSAITPSGIVNIRTSSVRRQLVMISTQAVSLRISV